MTKTIQRLTLALLLIGIALAAFRLSFDAQVTLAHGSGINTGLAWLYPLIIDAAIVAGVLIGFWDPTLAKSKLKYYLWGAVAFWTATSIAGNAFHVWALPPEDVTLPTPLAITVNSMPAITLFIIIHLATTTAFRPSRTLTGNKQEPPRSRKPRVSTDPTAPKRSDIPQVSDEQMLAMADGEGMSMQQIADRINRSKSYVGDRVKRLRESRDAA